MPSFHSRGAVLVEADLAGQRDHLGQADRPRRIEGDAGGLDLLGIQLQLALLAGEGEVVALLAGHQLEARGEGMRLGDPGIGHQAIAAGLEQQVLDLAGGTLDVGAEDHLLRRQRLAAALDPGLERAAVLRHQQFQGQVALAQQHAAARSAALALGCRFAGAGRRLPAQLQVGAAAQAEQCQCGHRDNRLLAHSVLPNRSGGAPAARPGNLTGRGGRCLHRAGAPCSPAPVPRRPARARTGHGRRPGCAGHRARRGS